MSESLAILLAISSMAGFGIADFIAKTIVTRTSAYRTAIVSQAVGSIPYFGLAVVYHGGIPSLPLILLTILSGGLSAVYLMSFYLALRLGKASLVTPVSSCFAVVAVVLSVLILGEVLMLPQLLLISAAIIGILLVAIRKGGTQPEGSSLSILLSVIVAVGAGSNSIVQKMIADSGDWMVGFSFTRVTMLGIMGLLYPVLDRESQTIRVRMEYPKLFLLGIIDVAAFFAYFLGLREGLVSIIAPIVNSSTVVTIMLAHVFLGERVLPHQKAGIVMIVLAVVLLSAIS